MPFPFNEWIVFVKKNNIFSINYILNIQEEGHGYKNWSYDFFYEQLLKVSNNTKVSSRILDNNRTIFGEGTYIINVIVEKSTEIEESIDETLAVIEDILNKTEELMSEFSRVHTALRFWNENKNNSSEEFWQNFF